MNEINKGASKSVRRLKNKWLPIMGIIGVGGLTFCLLGTAQAGKKSHPRPAPKLAARAGAKRNPNTPQVAPAAPLDPVALVKLGKREGYYDKNNLALTLFCPRLQLLSLMRARGSFSTRRGPTA